MNVLLTLLLAAAMLLASCGGNSAAEGSKQKQAETDVLAAGDDAFTDGYEAPQPRLSLFQLSPVEGREGVAFISLSDIYMLLDRPSDMLSLPSIEPMGVDSASYFRLAAPYRERFLSGAGISEADSLFIYDYAINKLFAYRVNELPAAAMVSVYTSLDSWPYLPYDYMIGFEVDAASVGELGEYYLNALAYVGSENPFCQEGLTPIRWAKADAASYPKREVADGYAMYFENATVGDTYLFTKDSLQYYLQSYANANSYQEVDLRRLMVVDEATGEVIIDKVFGIGEGTSPSPLNYSNENVELNQWTGRLFKGMPPVVFGFEYVSFGCPYISVIDKSGEDIELCCDNRH